MAENNGGDALLCGGFENPTGGQFEIIGNTFVAAIDVQEGQGNRGFLALTARTDDGTLGIGFLATSTDARPTTAMPHSAQMAAADGPRPRSGWQDDSTVYSSHPARNNTRLSANSHREG